MSHTYTNLLIHAIFSTKDRRPLITADLQPRLCAYLGGILRELACTAHAINGMPDHVHLLLSLPATLSVAEALKILKANSSRWVHETWPEHRDFAWQTGYAAFSVSQSNRHAVQRYIMDQQAHRRRQSFAEEWQALLRKHGLHEYQPLAGMKSSVAPDGASGNG